MDTNHGNVDAPRSPGLDAAAMHDLDIGRRGARVTADFTDQDAVDPAWVWKRNIAY